MRAISVAGGAWCDTGYIAFTILAERGERNVYPTSEVSDVAFLIHLGAKWHRGEGADEYF